MSPPAARSCSDDEEPPRPVTRDYYAGRGESPGVWTGSGAYELELDGVVQEGQLGRLINGRDPLTSAVLRRHPPKRVVTVERIDPATASGGWSRDALAGPDVRHAVDQSHLAAWQAAL
jgi:hypothetical protein